jgi:hypothetical protein
MNINSFIRDMPLFRGLDVASTEWLASCAQAGDVSGG